MSNLVKDFDSEYKNSVEFFKNFSNKYYVIINFLNSSINLNLNDLENDKNNIDLVNRNIILVQSKCIKLLLILIMF